MLVVYEEGEGGRQKGKGNPTIINQPCDDDTKERCPENFDPQATITGKAQEEWLYDGLDKSTAKWNVLAQQVIIAQRDTTPGPVATYSMDKWDGYLARRDRLMGFLEQRKPSNPVALTGDVHNHWAMDLKADFDNPESAIVGSEFVCTSITSGGNGADTNPTVLASLPENPFRCKITDANFSPLLLCSPAPLLSKR